MDLVVRSELQKQVPFCRVALIPELLVNIQLLDVGGSALVGQPIGQATDASGRLGWRRPH